MKRFFIIIFAFILSTSAVFAEDAKQNNSPQNNQTNQEILSKSQYPISVIDPTPSTNPPGAFYPGVRGANQLIIYTPKFGQRTGTNEFGKEAVVEDDYVVKLTGSNSVIPQNGFVISTHGKAKNWMDENIKEGVKIKIDLSANTIESMILPKSFIYKANKDINEEKKTLDEYQKNIQDYNAVIARDYLNQAEKKLTEAKEFLDKKDYVKTEKLSLEASSLANKALYNTIPAKPDEFHGIWLRPVEKNKTEIDKTLDKIKSAGIDNIFIETYTNGYTIYPSKTLELYGLTPQKKEFQGWDPLSVWIKEAHKRKMKIHAWFETFYAGNDDPSKHPGYVIAAYPKWANIQKIGYEAQNPTPSLSEHHGYFLDPANPEVQKYLGFIITEISNNYAIDGINIDYIRYPASLPRNFPNYILSTWGYSDYARNEFKNMYGVDPVELTADSPQWQYWVAYRQEKVTSFVSRLKDFVQNKKIIISTVIFPDPEESAALKLQNWKDWDDLVDAFTPLILGSDNTLAADYVNGIKSVVNGRIKIFTGLFEPFTAGTPADLLYQVKSVREAGANGIVIFDKAHLNQDFTDALSTRAFNKAENHNK